MIEEAPSFGPHAVTAHVPAVMRVAHDLWHKAAARPRRYNRRVRPVRILIVAGLLVWALSGIDVLQDFISPSGPRPWAPLIAWLLFVAAFLCEDKIVAQTNKADENKAAKCPLLFDFSQHRKK